MLPSGALLIPFFSCVCRRGQLPLLLSPPFLTASWVPGLSPSCLLIILSSLAWSPMRPWRSLRASSHGFRRPCDTISLISELRGAFRHDQPPRLTCASSALALKPAKAGRFFRNQDLGTDHASLGHSFQKCPTTIQDKVQCILPEGWFPAKRHPVSPSPLSSPAIPLVWLLPKPLCRPPALNPQPRGSVPSKRGRGGAGLGVIQVRAPIHHNCPPHCMTLGKSAFLSVRFLL